MRRLGDWISMSRILHVLQLCRGVLVLVDVDRKIQTDPRPCLCWMRRALCCEATLRISSKDAGTRSGRPGANGWFPCFLRKDQYHASCRCILYPPALASSGNSIVCGGDAVRLGSGASEAPMGSPNCRIWEASASGRPPAEHSTGTVAMLP